MFTIKPPWRTPWSMAYCLEAFLYFWAACAPHQVVLLHLPVFWGPNNSSFIFERSASYACSDKKAGDMIFKNAVLFMRDILISWEFTDAIKASNSGPVVLVSKAWALSFWGNGQTKFAFEMLHLIHNITKVWSTKMRYIVILFPRLEVQVIFINYIGTLS